ncbi:O-antigen ligase family protein [Microbacterium sp. GXF7504]
MSAPARTRLRLWISPDAAAVVIIVLLWVRSVGQLIALSLTVDKVSQGVGEEAASSALSSAVSQGAYVALLAVCGVAVLFHLNDITRPGLWRIAVMLVPWLWQLTRGAYAGQVAPDALLYPLLVLALAALRPRPRVLAAVGVLVGLTAIVAVVLGFVAPDAGIVREADGTERVRSDKALFPSLGLLQGMFTSENTLAGFLVLGVASILLVRPLWLRLLLLAGTAFAIAWSSSRGGLITLAVVAVVGLVIAGLRLYERMRAASLLARLGAAGALAVAAALPFLGWDDDAFSVRGVIWNVSLEQWTEHALWFGLDAEWYTRMALTETSPLHAGAVHAHNDVLQMLVTGGLVLGVLFIAWFCVIGYDITRVGTPLLTVAAMLLIAIATSGALEVVSGFVTGSRQWVGGLVPLCVLFFAPKREASKEGSAGAA